MNTKKRIKQIFALLFTAAFLSISVINANSIDALAYTDKGPDLREGAIPAIIVSFTNFDTSRVVYKHDPHNRDKQPKGKVKGVTYNKGTNTLTLKNVSSSVISGISIKGMGKDFKIKLVGKNSIKHLTISASNSDKDPFTARPTSVTFIGNGELTIKDNLPIGPYTSLEMYANGSKSQIIFSKNAKVKVAKSAKCSIYVFGSRAKQGIVTRGKLNKKIGSKVSVGYENKGDSIARDFYIKSTVTNKKK